MLRWATLGIEYHHIHHLNTKVPGYALRECHESAPEGGAKCWRAVTFVGYAEAARAMLNVMYDERAQKMVPFGGGGGRGCCCSGGDDLGKRANESSSSLGGGVPQHKQQQALPRRQELKSM